MNKMRRGLVTTACALLVAALLPAASAAPAQPAAADPSPGTKLVAGEQVGRWRVTSTSPVSHTLSWRSPRPLPVTDARPQIYAGEVLLGAPELSADGRTLTLTVDAPAAPDPDDLSVLLSGRALDSTAPVRPRLLAGAPQRPAVAPYVAPAPGRTLADDPGTRGVRRVVVERYRLRPVRIAGMPAPVEMLGHVVRPAGTATDRPLVLFLHGRHQPCFRDRDGTGRGEAGWPCPRGTSPVPSHLGYHYVQRQLASQGYVTVSVSANGINAQDFLLGDGGSAARATLVRRHLERWAQWAATGRFAVDMSRVVLVGHSRGGEGVDQAALETPLRAPYRIVGQVLLAPTNFGRRVAAYVPTVTVLPYCDGDVVDLQGQSYTDLGRDLTGDDTALRSSVLMMGANHNYFNTEWTPRISVAPSFDDGRFLPGRLCRPGSGSRLAPAEQRAAARTYIAGAVAMTAGADSSVVPMFDGSNVTVPSAGGADVRVHALGGGRGMRRPGRGAAPHPDDTAATRLCAGRSGSSRTSICGRGLSGVRTPHWVPDSPFTRGVPSAAALQMRWSRAGQTGSLVLSRPLDLSAAPALDLRTAVDPALGHVRLRVRVYDGSGAVGELTGPRGRLVRALPGRDLFVFGKVWAQTLRVRVRATSAVDLTDVRRVELVGASARGRVWLLDLAATRTGLAPVPLRRLPRISLGGLTVREGDGRSQRMARVPFRVQGAVRAPATFVVLRQDFTTGRTLRPQRLTLRPGQTRGTVPVAYTPDRLDDLRVQQTQLVALPLRGAMTRDYQGRLRLLDDDPAPRVRVRTVRPRVVEGRTARWRVTLSREVGYTTFVVGNVVPGETTRPRLRAGDVPRSWLRRHFFPVPPASRPLHDGRPVVFDSIRPGRTQAVLAVPVRRDGAAEGPEAVTLRVRLVPDIAEPVERTVTVED